MRFEFLEGNLVKATVYTLTPHSIASIRADELVALVRDVGSFVPSDPVLVEEAGALGGDLETTISSIAGNDVTLAAAAHETVSRKRFGRRTNPSTATFKVKRPDGTIDTIVHPHADIANPIAGKFVLTYTPPAGANRHGLYLVRFVSTGTAACAEEGTFTLTPSGID